MPGGGICRAGTHPTPWGARGGGVPPGVEGDQVSKGGGGMGVTQGRGTQWDVAVFEIKGALSARGAQFRRRARFSALCA